MIKRRDKIFLAVVHVLGLFLGGLLVYAKDHPNGVLHTAFVNLGFHLK